MNSWSVDDAHEALCWWGAWRIRDETGARGHARESAGMGDRRERPVTALAPTDLARPEIAVIDEVVESLQREPLVIVKCYYIPGHLQFANLGVNGYGRQRAVSEQNLADALSIPASRVHTTLVGVRRRIAEKLTCLAGS